MGTRGFFGWVVDGKLVGQYNHYGSYPSGTGKEFLNQIKKLKDLEKVKENLIKVEEVRQDSPMTKEDIKAYSKFGNAQIGNNSMANEVIRDWQQLLHGLQGNLTPYFKGEVNHIINSKEFMEDSLFCEWAYVLNLDSEELEVYEGYVQTPHNTNKYYKCEGTKEYYPVKLIATYKLSDLPTDEEFIKLEGCEQE